MPQHFDFFKFKTALKFNFKFKSKFLKISKAVEGEVNVMKNKNFHDVRHP